MAGALHSRCNALHGSTAQLASSHTAVPHAAGHPVAGFMASFRQHSVRSGAVAPQITASCNMCSSQHVYALMPDVACMAPHRWMYCRRAVLRHDRCCKEGEGHVGDPAGGHR